MFVDADFATNRVRYCRLIRVSRIVNNMFRHCHKNLPFLFPKFKVLRFIWIQMKFRGNDRSNQCLHSPLSVSLSLEQLHSAHSTSVRTQLRHVVICCIAPSPARGHYIYHLPLQSFFFFFKYILGWRICKTEKKTMLFPIQKKINTSSTEQTKRKKQIRTQKKTFLIFASFLEIL